VAQPFVVSHYLLMNHEVVSSILALDNNFVYTCPKIFIVDYYVWNLLGLLGLCLEFTRTLIGTIWTSLGQLGIY
jgi:hypothetical protein